jgi:hypothetical protein
MSTNTQQLQVLRSRTDDDLLVLVNRELDRGISAAQFAPDKSSQLCANAEKSLSSALALFPWLSDLGQNDRLRIESRIKELRYRLDHVSVYRTRRDYMASLAS